MNYISVDRADKDKGYSIHVMARHLCRHRQTAINYLNMEIQPWKSQCHVNPLEKFFTYIKNEWRKNKAY